MHFTFVRYTSPVSCTVYHWKVYTVLLKSDFQLLPDLFRFLKFHIFFSFCLIVALKKFYSLGHIGLLLNGRVCAFDSAVLVDLDF